jgi:hypothetical protein
MLASQIMSQVDADESYGTHHEIMVAAALFSVFIIVRTNRDDVNAHYVGDPRNPPIFLFNQHDSQGKGFHYLWMKRN